MLLLLAALFSLTPSFAKDPENREQPCPANDIVSPLSGQNFSECSRLWGTLRELRTRLPEAEQRVAEAITQSQRAAMSRVDNNRGAQCGLARVLDTSVGAYNAIRGPYRHAREVMQARYRREEHRAEILRQYESGARALRCYDECRASLMNRIQRNCSQDCQLPPPPKGGRSAASAQTYETAMQEWRAFFRFVDEFYPEVERKVEGWERQSHASVSQLDRIQQRYNCEGVGLEAAYEVAHRQQGLPSPELVAPSRFDTTPLTPERQELEERMRRSSMQLTTQGGDMFGRANAGTAFNTRAGDGRYVFTAQHVAGRDFLTSDYDLHRFYYYTGNRLPVSLEDPAGMHYMQSGEAASGSLQFRADAEFFDPRADVIGQSWRGGGEALEIARSSDVIQPGQRVLIGGYPGSGDLAFTTYECTLLGHTQGLIESSYNNYALDCPGVSRRNGGMSGGPVVEMSSGRVIGLVSAEARGMERNVIVAPIQQRDDGSVRIGLTPGSSQRCYGLGRSFNRPFTCMVGSGG